eukprot:1036187-Pleurochrysis_carterae.AAC.3
MDCSAMHSENPYKCGSFANSYTQQPQVPPFPETPRQTSMDRIDIFELADQLMLSPLDDRDEDFAGPSTLTLSSLPTELLEHIALTGPARAMRAVCRFDLSAVASKRIQRAHRHRPPPISPYIGARVLFRRVRAGPKSASERRRFKPLYGSVRSRTGESCWKVRLIDGSTHLAAPTRSIKVLEPWKDGPWHEARDRSSYAPPPRIVLPSRGASSSRAVAPSRSAASSSTSAPRAASTPAGLLPEMPFPRAPAPMPSLAPMTSLAPRTPAMEAPTAVSLTRSSSPPPSRPTRDACRLPARKSAPDLVQLNRSSAEYAPSLNSGSCMRNSLANTHHAPAGTDTSSFCGGQHVGQLHHNSFPPRNVF